MGSRKDWLWVELRMGRWTSFQVRLMWILVSEENCCACRGALSSGLFDEVINSSECVI